MGENGPDRPDPIKKMRERADLRAPIAKAAEEALVAVVDLYNLQDKAERLRENITEKVVRASAPLGAEVSADRLQSDVLVSTAALLGKMFEDDQAREIYKDFRAAFLNRLKS